MIRKPDWAARLNKYIAKVQNKKFRMGKWDCVHFGAGAVKAMTGVDLMKEFRGQYSSEETAKDALERLGRKTLYQTIRHKLGNTIPASKAKRGDIAYSGGRVGVIIGRYALFLTEEGYHQTPIQFVSRAFRIKFHE